MARDTKLGRRNHPRYSEPVGRAQLQGRLDESGIVYIGAEVETGDVLVGKVTPKGETQLTPEENCCARSLAKSLGRERHLAARSDRHRKARLSMCSFTREGIERDKRAQSIIDDHLRH